MTDTMAPEVKNEAPQVADTSADDAKYAEMEAKYAPKPDPAPEPQEAPQEAKEEQPEAKAEKPPLPPEELQQRLRQTQAALKEERRRRQEIEAKAQIEAKPQANPFIESLKGIPDPEEDPIGAVEHIRRVLADYAQQEETDQRQTFEQQQQQAQFQRFAATLNEHEADFLEENPDYTDAQAFFKDSLRKELSGMGHDGEELEIELAKQVIGVAQKALDRGKNPAEVVYSLAKLRGFGATSPQVTASQAQQPAPVNQEIVDKAAETIQTLSKTQQASKSLSSVGGASGSGELTLAQVNKLSGKAFLDGMAKLREQAKRTGTYYR